MKSPQKHLKEYLVKPRCESRTVREAVLSPFMLVDFQMTDPASGQINSKRIPVWLSYDEAEPNFGEPNAGDMGCKRMRRTLNDFQDAPFVWRRTAFGRTKIYLVDCFKTHSTDVLVSVSFADGTMSAWMPVTK